MGQECKTQKTIGGGGVTTGLIVKVTSTCDSGSLAVVARLTPSCKMNSGFSFLHLYLKVMFHPSYVGL